MDIKEDLVAWLHHHLAARNQILDEVIEMQDDSGGWDVYLKTKSKEQFYLVLPALVVSSVVAKAKPDAHVCVVVPNNHRAVQETINHWDELARLPKLCIIYANPHAPYDKKWSIYPATHEKLIGKKNLKTALMTLFAGVPEYREPKTIKE